MTKPIRTRFAPSPTGFMHVGGIRTALFGWLFARANDGVFILRIEDTDKAREVEGSIEHIQESLAWLGISPDEGPSAGGEFGPYKQSERLKLYKKYAQILIDKELAYIDPFTKEEVQTFREEAKILKKPFLFRNYRPETTEVPEDWYGKHSLRFKTTDVKRHTWNDVVRGELSAGEEALDDFVLVKSDGYPTYNFAHVIDDQEMQISHIVRGEEFIPSVPKFLSLYDALEITAPEFVTVPPILNSNGGKKLSKRDGAKDVLEYRDDGYLPESVNNFLCSLGWNDGTEKEIFTIDELVSAFSPDRIQKSGAKFDETKLEWIEWQHRQAAINSDPAAVLGQLGFSDEDTSPGFAALALTKSRSLEDFKDQYGIYTDPGTFELTDENLKNVDKSLDSSKAAEYLTAGANALEGIKDFTTEKVEEVLRAKMAELEAAPRAFLNLLRWAVSNKKVSPNLFETISLIGKDKATERLNRSQ